MKAKKVIVLSLLAILLVSTFACGGGGTEEEATPTPTPTLTPTPTVTPTPTPLPSGWIYHTVHEFEIGLPADWIALEISAEAIDAMIEEMGPTNPEMVPVLEALKHQEGIDFWAVDPASLPGLAVNIMAGHEIRVMSLDASVELLKEQVEPIGCTITVGEKFTLRGCEAVRLQTNCTAYYPSGEPYQVEQQMVIIDHGGYRYVVILTCPPEHAQRYKELFDSVVQSFNIVE